MRALMLSEICEVDAGDGKRVYPELPLKKNPLEMVNMPNPEPGPGEILIKISACGVCHTELDEIEGRRKPALPVVPGHEVIGRVATLGKDARKFKIGDRVGVAWIFSSCGKCRFCGTGMENLCEDFIGTGCDANGGYAEMMVVGEDYAFKIPDVFEDSQAAPLMCAGAVGYRALRLTNMKDGEILGLFGFGASAHVIIQVVRRVFPNSPVYVFTRNKAHRDLAVKLGAAWTGGPDDEPPQKINRAIDFTPIGETVARAMSAMEKGGRLIINAIRKKTSVCLDYADHLWHEKEVKSVANVTPADVREFLSLAAQIPIIPEIQEFHPEEANKAMRLLKQSKINGAGVLRLSNRQ